jgi:leader peptidase (prepilin peptidase) / N-methyltransferase
VDERSLVALACGLLGLLVGSFLNVVVWRVPRGESVVRPPSHCPGCDTPIAPRDNVPVLSWLLLRGRCRTCDERISARYPLVELGCAVLFAAMGVRFGLAAVLPAFLYLAAVGLALALIDVDVHRLPDALTLPSYLVAPALLGAASAVDGTGEDFLRALLGLAGMFAVYFLLFVAAPRGMGYGDVKLSGVLGAYLGYLGWDVWAVGLVGGFLLGGGFGVLLLLTRKGGRKTKVPFGPFMLLGAMVAVLAGEPIARAWLGT